MKDKLVFLGGTCGNNQWRKPFIIELVANGVDPKCLFNPVVDNWNEAAQDNEEKVKKKLLIYYFI